MPAIGVLFRATTRSKTKTELLIVLTPRVVRTVEDARRMSIENRDVTSVLTQEQKQSVLMNGLRLTPESDDEAIESSQQEPVQQLPAEEGTMQPISYAQPAAGGVAGAPGEATYGPFAPEYGPFGANKPTARPATTIAPAPPPPVRSSSTWSSPASPEFAAPAGEGTETLEAQPLEPYDPKSP
jgi:general secretion pathway protein D